MRCRAPCCETNQKRGMNGGLLKIFRYRDVGNEPACPVTRDHKAEFSKEKTDRAGESGTSETILLENVAPTQKTASGGRSNSEVATFYARAGRGGKSATIRERISRIWLRTSST